MTKPRQTPEEFAELRRKRNEAVRACVEAIAKQRGWNLAKVQSNHNDDACYCDCPNGPCEHDWTGPWQEMDGGGTATCARCGATAFSHDLRVLP